jgi:hypothetical protein
VTALAMTLATTGQLALPRQQRSTGQPSVRVAHEGPGVSSRIIGRPAAPRPP